VVAALQSVGLEVDLSGLASQNTAISDLLAALVIDVTRAAEEPDRRRGSRSSTTTTPSRPPKHIRR
jgi:hypothetical protein